MKHWAALREGGEGAWLACSRTADLPGGGGLLWQPQFTRSPLFSGNPCLEAPSEGPNRAWPRSLCEMLIIFPSSLRDPFPLQVSTLAWLLLLSPPRAPLARSPCCSPLARGAGPLGRGVPAARSPAGKGAILVSPGKAKACAAACPPLTARAQSGRRVLLPGYRDPGRGPPTSPGPSPAPGARSQTLQASAAHAGGCFFPGRSSLIQPPGL